MSGSWFESFGMSAYAQAGMEPDLGMRIQLVHGDEVILQLQTRLFTGANMLNIEQLTAHMPNSSSLLLTRCFAAASAHLTCRLARV
jgi:hypothetical protein